MTARPARHHLLGDVTLWLDASQLVAGADRFAVGEQVTWRVVAEDRVGAEPALVAPQGASGVDFAVGDIEPARAVTVSGEIAAIWAETVPLAAAVGPGEARAPRAGNIQRVDGAPSAAPLRQGSYFCGYRVRLVGATRSAC